MFYIWKFLLLLCFSLQFQSHIYSLNSASSVCIHLVSFISNAVKNGLDYEFSSFYSQFLFLLFYVLSNLYLFTYYKVTMTNYNNLLPSIEEWKRLSAARCRRKFFMVSLENIHKLDNLTRSIQEHISHHPPHNSKNMFAFFKKGREVILGQKK